MVLENVDCLLEYVRNRPDLKKRIRIQPLQFRVGKHWRRVTGIKVSSRGITIQTPGNRSFLICTDSKKPYLRVETQNALIDMIVERMKPCRLVSVARSTDRIRHQSGAFVRIILKKNRRFLPLIGVDWSESSELQSRLMVSTILWWEQLRHSLNPTRIQVWIPNHWSERILDQIALINIPIDCYQYCLDSRTLQPVVSRQNPETELDSPYQIHWKSDYPEPFAELKAKMPQLDLVYRKMRWELSLFGFPLAWSEPGGQLVLNSRSGPRSYPAIVNDFRELMENVAKTRSYPPSRPDHFFYRYGHERWLESIVLRNLPQIDPELSFEIYSQVPTWIGGERRVLDLLGVTEKGQLTVIELKVERDLSLLFQGLDYWQRVKYHLEKGDFQKAGYFQNRQLRPIKPLLYLVTPYFQLHRTYPTLACYLKDDLPCRLIGINSNWKQGLKLIRRVDLAGGGAIAKDC